MNKENKTSDKHENGNDFIADVSNNEAVSFTDHSDELRCSEVAFCSSPFHDFDNCPLMAKTDNCKRCSNYEDGTK